MLDRKPLAMRESRVMRKLREGQVAFAFKINLADIRVVDIAARLTGMDCLWTDMEHVPNDYSMIEKQIMTAKAYDLDMIVRVSKGSYSDMIKPLEMDATGIMVPHVMSLKEAKEIVYYTKFQPIGRRPLDGGNADGIYCNLSADEYTQQANKQRFNILQIEDHEPLDELEDIITLPGVDIIFFGPGDFSHSLGWPLQLDHPKLIETQKRIGELAMKHGKYAGTVGSVDTVEALIDQGFRLISIGADVIGINQYCNELYNKLANKNISLNKSIYQG